MDLRKFAGVKVSDETCLSPLQYVDDNIAIGQARCENLWVLKVVSVASTFLYCNIGSVPFKFFGLLIGANPRNGDTWNPIIASMKRMLAS